VLHDWSFALCVYPIYRMVLLVRTGLVGQVFDAWLIDADRWLFGVAPAGWLARLAHPVVTEVLQLAYAIFCLLPLAVSIELYAGSVNGGSPVGVRLRVRVLRGVRRVPGAAGCRPPLRPARPRRGRAGAAGLWLTPDLRALIDEASMVPWGPPRIRR